MEGTAGRSPGRPLHAVLETEIEGVLQSVFAARQDVLEARRDPRALEPAARGLQDCVSTLQVLLGLLRAVPRPGPVDDAVPVVRGSDGFGILSPAGELLYMNAAVTRVLGRDHRSLARTPFHERGWTDRVQMRAHLDRAHDTGRDEDTFSVQHGDGRVLRLTFRTERIDVPGADPVLLMQHVEAPPA